MNRFRLWEREVPDLREGDEGNAPFVQVYKPQNTPKRAAMLVFPGGGYNALMDYEGHDYAVWLATQGYTALVVNYRLASQGYQLPTIFGDAQRAVRWARAQAGNLGYEPQRIGVIGSSAGGHLCALLSVHGGDGQPAAGDAVERQPARPDLAVLCYPAIYLHEVLELRQLFGGSEPEAEIQRFYSADAWVTAQTSPAFLFHTAADQLVPSQHSLLYAQALATAGVPYELHIYQDGPHGVALGNGHPWTRECLRWLESRFTQ